MKKAHVILMFTAVMLLFITSFYYCAKMPSERPQIGASSPTQTQGDVRPAVTGQTSVTVGTLRMRRRHENDMDFSKYNPFYWQGRLAEYRIEDHTSRGENRITVTLTTEWPQDNIPTRGVDFSVIYSGDPVSPTEHLRSKFLYNIRMNHVRDNRVFTATLDQGSFNASGGQLARGQVITMEFRFFMQESFPDWQRQKQANHHNLSAYYSEFVRIRVGEPGLLIDHPTQANGVASELRYSGGKTTTVTARVEPWRALGQMATNIDPKNAQAFLWGRTWLHTDMTTGEHVGEASDDKPSVFFPQDRVGRSGHQSETFNVRSCVACHDLNGSQLLPGVGQPIHTTILRTVDAASGGVKAHPAFRQQIQTQGSKPEGTVKIVRWDLRYETLNGGERVELRSPVWNIEAPNVANLGYSPRRPMPFVGLGLLEAIPEDTIRRFARENGGTISLDGTRIGRFGHKAERGTLIDQVSSATNIDLGVRTDGSQYSDCGNGCGGGKQLFQPAVNDMVTYLQLLGVPPRLKPEDPAVQRGNLIFRRIGCATCHVPDMQTGTHAFAELSNQNIQPFTDLLLHDMGDGLKDFTGNALARKWRTAPLWATKDKRAATDSRQGQFAPGNVNILWTDTWNAVKNNRIEMMHDGRARTMAEAILWHGGEAEASKEAYRNLPKQERDDLEAFLWDL